MKKYKIYIIDIINKTTDKDICLTKEALDKAVDFYSKVEGIKCFTDKKTFKAFKKELKKKNIKYEVNN